MKVIEKKVFEKKQRLSDQCLHLTIHAYFLRSLIKLDGARDSI